MWLSHIFSLSTTKSFLWFRTAISEDWAYFSSWLMHSSSFAAVLYCSAMVSKLDVNFWRMSWADKSLSMLCCLCLLLLWGLDIEVVVFIGVTTRCLCCDYVIIINSAYPLFLLFRIIIRSVSEARFSQWCHKYFNLRCLYSNHVYPYPSNMADILSAEFTRSYCLLFIFI